MAVTAREMRKTAYRNSIYVQGNTAIRRNEKQLYALPEEVPAKKQLSTRTRKNREKAHYMNISYILFMTMAMITAGVILTWYLNLQSEITASIKNIARLESQLNDMKLDNDENHARINSSIDLEEVRRVAVQELGMCYAAEGQIITFNGEGSDYVRQVGEIPD